MVHPSSVTHIRFKVHSHVCNKDTGMSTYGTIAVAHERCQVMPGIGWSDSIAPASLRNIGNAFWFYANFRLPDPP